MMKHPFHVTFNFQNLIFDLIVKVFAMVKPEQT